MTSMFDTSTVKWLNCVLHKLPTSYFTFGKKLFQAWLETCEIKYGNLFIISSKILYTFYMEVCTNLFMMWFKLRNIIITVSFVFTGNMQYAYINILKN